MIKEGLISISEMAALHGLTRPTLLYYDTIGLFSPVRVDDNGYRFYSYSQIPVLREICFLKALGVSLKEIRQHLKARNPEAELQLLTEQAEKLEKERRSLERKQLAIQQRLYSYREAVSAENYIQDEPFFRHLKERYVLVNESPMIEQGGTLQETMYLRFMELWRDLQSHEFMPTYRYGILHRYDSFGDDGYPTAAVCYILIPEIIPGLEHPIEVIPESDYLCYYKKSRPGDTTMFPSLFRWVVEHGYRVTGDIPDSCFLDATFDQEQSDTIFTMIQIPVQKL